MNRKIILLLSTLLLTLPALADEGMWLPLLLGRNEADMQAKGMRITADDIYSANHASLKDAVVHFGRGCTGEFISNQGLVLTNHHCGYSYIVKHSTVERDYLRQGFWAATQAEEIPCPGLTVTHLVRMEDVTDRILADFSDTLTMKEREKLIEQRIKQVGEAAIEGTHYSYEIKPLFYGNQYIMYINEVFNDVRMVGAPPSSIGNFGDDVDNWMWPRHTGDFSLFRVYADSLGRPAKYSPANRPYRPVQHLTISLRGLNEGDFTFTYGYPGRTTQYLTSDELACRIFEENPIDIAFADITMQAYRQAMAQSDEQRLRYADKFAGEANVHKLRQAEIASIRRIDGVAQKQEFERRFQAWAQDKPQYAGVLPALHKDFVEILRAENVARQYRYLWTSMDFLMHTNMLYASAQMGDSDYAKQYRQMIVGANDHYHNKKHYRKDSVERDIFVRKHLYAWQQGMAPQLGDTNATVEEVTQRLNHIYDHSLIADHKKLDKLLSNYRLKDSTKVLSDPAVKLYADLYAFSDEQRKYLRQVGVIESRFDSLMSVYMRGIMEMQGDKPLAPDANSTLRVSYGNVMGYSPRDGVQYMPFTTLRGVIEKDDPSVSYFAVPQRLKELYHAKDYGRYANVDGELTTCFLSNNHITGGNSGSPVLDADGRLVGVAFDGVWEGSSDDYLFSPDYTRTISLDIRYCLFVIDKFAGASHLIEEMTIVE